jgi:hypothetical protein
VVLYPDLDIALQRAAQRVKRVPPDIIRDQHGAAALWPEQFRVDTGDISVEESLALIDRLIDRPAGSAGS